MAKRPQRIASLANQLAKTTEKDKETQITWTSDFQEKNSLTNGM